MKTATKHTATLLPWQLGNSGNGIFNIFYTDGELRSQIAVLRPEWLCPEHGGTPLGNTEIILKAVNNYERVRAERDELKKALKFSRSVHVAQGLYDLSERIAVEKIDAALAKVEPKGE